jgi:general secretion pathway protein A
VSAVAEPVTRDPRLAHWGLLEPPFALDPDPRFSFERADHREGLARILFGITQIGGIVLVTGEVGCGKTMLATSLTTMMRGDGIRVARVSNPPRTGSALLGDLLQASGAETRGRTAADRASALRAHLASRDGRVALLVDEAQRLDRRALDELRMLTNPDDSPGAPVVLLGQPELLPKITAMPQVDQRVAVRHHLAGMTAPEVKEYIDHRTRVAGAERSLFSNRAVQAIHDESGGIPRLVNMTCASALFIAAVRGETKVTEDTVRDIAEDRRAEIDPDRDADQ